MQLQFTVSGLARNAAHKGPIHSSKIIELLHIRGDLEMQESPIPASIMKQ